MSFTYQLSYATRSRQIDPKQIGKLVSKIEEGEKFFRTKLEGSLVVDGDDFKFLLEAEYYAEQCCQEITLSINRKSCSGTQTPHWLGYFSLQNIAWDLDNQTCTISKIGPKDPYDCVYRNWQREINLLEFLEKAPFEYSGPSTSTYTPTGVLSYERGMDLADSIAYLCRLTLRFTECEAAAQMSRSQLSHFLTDEANPVTGQANFLREVVIMQLTDARNPDASNPALKGMITLKDMLSGLKDLFSAYWFINDDGRIQIEHESYFPALSYDAPIQTLDLTSPAFADVTKGMRAYDYQIDKLYGVEGLEIALNKAVQDTPKPQQGATAQFTYPEFGSAYLVYANVCVPTDDKGQRTESVVSNSLFMTDFLSCVHSPDLVPDYGWLLVQVRFIEGVSTVVDASLPLTGGTYANGNLSAARLYKSFKRHSASFSYGTFTTDKGNAKSGRPMRALGVAPAKRFKTLTLELCCGDSYDFSGTIKHPLADVTLAEQSEINLLEGIIELTLIATTPCNNIPVPDSDDENEPAEGCRPYGEYIRTLTSEAYCEDGVTVMEYITEDVYADGNCGEYVVRTSQGNGAC